uniref:Serine-threonine/tyrosine-protein kinase catalytic domain-containing protein n=1 Tax=Lotharella oceanica TaxID=641309 RepID=A0A7S2TJB6_9EUKA|eukprot:CAMPEP_0170184386 /NCGR_PEP_ID=MMETSP0040_2-20121228/33495_1 /TAXON_ID=641309 /ORGANISM="Lotharella oceanica, Strain CCMP622" /LENGTH=149 /DNA_ID=CAMNT_0010430443 /DNA_START=57 /DNA_END=506 /DNA_ORIENTATION=+
MTNPLELREKVTRGDRPEIPSHTPPPLAALLESMWHQEIIMRPTTAQVLEVLEKLYATMMEKENTVEDYIMVRRTTDLQDGRHDAKSKGLHESGAKMIGSNMSNTRNRGFLAAPQGPQETIEEEADVEAQQNEEDGKKNDGRQAEHIAV